MPRDRKKSDSAVKNSQTNDKAQAASESDTEHRGGKNDSDEYVDVEHEDLDMQETDDRIPSRLVGGLDLQRYGNNIEDPHGNDDDEDEENNSIAHHPLLGMLAGRLGQRRRGSTHKYDSLHPENQVLTASHVSDCVILENSCFPENERASPEKLEYRLNRCPELSFGLFTRPTKAEAEKMTTTPKGKMMAHIISTRTPAPGVTEESMAVPPDWQSKRSTIPSASEDKPLGHQAVGDTICIHSLAVTPEHQGIGLGTVIMKSYIERIRSAKIAKRIALLAHDELVKFYEKLGFEDVGESSVKFGGGAPWRNMILELSDQDEE